MKTAVFLLSLILTTINGAGQLDQLPECNGLNIQFDRPWFPQWEGGLEISHPAVGYRMDGYPANLTITGHGLDPSETIHLENRDSMGRFISGIEIKVDANGKLFYRAENELPDEFIPNRFYQVYFIRESGEEIRAGGFYVADKPPEDYLYKVIGDTTYGFNCDDSGRPYLLSWLSYKDGPNILDNYEGRGREFQGDLVDGYPEHGDSFKYDTVFPCQGAGDYGRILPVVSASQIEADYIYAKTKPLSFEPNRSENDGPYRQTITQGRWPENGWNLETEYIFNSNDITLRNRFWHTDNYNHRVHQIRTAQMFLNPLFFQNGIINENKRNHDSYLMAVIKDERVESYSDALGLKITFRADVDNYDDFYSQRQWNYRNELELAEPGTVQVWEALNVAEINQFIPRNQVSSGWGKITITDTSRLGVWFDLEKLKEHLKMVWEQNRYDWNK